MTATALGSRFVGRADELSALLDTLDRLRLGQGSAVLICGEAGIGKTRLIEEVRDRCAIGTIWSTGNCVQEALAPFAPIFSVLDSLRIATTELQQVGSKSSDPFAKLGLCRTIISGLEDKARVTPLVIFLDDIQWIDPETFELIGLLLERLDKHAIATILACRTPDLSRPNFEPLLDRILRGQVRKIDLARLSSSEVREIVSDTLLACDTELSEERLIHVIRLAEGNPLYLKELLRDAIERRNEDVPDAIKIMAESRLRVLDVSAQRMVLVASAFGERILSSQLASVLGSPIHEVEERLQQMCISQLMIEQGEGAYRFAHALLREALYKRMTAAFAKSTHRKIAFDIERSEARGSDTLGFLAYQYHSAGMDQEAVRCYVAAGDAAMRNLGYGAATEFFNRALLNRTRISPREESLIVQKLAEALARNGRTEKAIPYFERSLSDAAADDTDRRIQLFRGLARAYHDSGKGREAISVIDRLVAEMGINSVPRDLTFLAAICEFNLLRDRRGDWFTRVARTIKEFDLATQCHFRTLVASQHFMTGDIDAAEELYRGAIETAHKLKDQRLVVRILITRASELSVIGKVAEAVEASKGAFEQAARLEKTWHPYSRMLQLFSCFAYAYELSRVGRLSEARDIMKRVGDLTFDTTIARILASAAKLRIDTLCGETSSPHLSAAAHLRLLDLALDTGHQDTIAATAEALAIFYQTAGDLETARYVLRIALQRLDSGLNAQEMLLLVAEFGGWDEVGEARALLLGSLAHCLRLKRDAYLNLFDSFVYRRQGKRATSQRRAQRASAALKELGEEYRYAQSLQLLGSGRASLELFKKMGARVTGVRKPRARATDRAGDLTPRQQELCELVSRGLSNIEIAGRLGISEGTVRIHLTQVFKRLGIRSRGQLMPPPSPKADGKI